MIDPLTRVPGIWRAGMRVSINGEPGSICHDKTWGLIWRPDAAPSWILPVPAEVDERWTSAEILDDPTGATTGCLQAFCRELWRLPDLYCRPLLPGGWVVTRQFTNPAIGADFDDCHGNTEPAAWRAAILAHPSLSELR